MRDFYPWQVNSVDTLLMQMGTGKLPHALLFTGAEGIGKLNFALTFVQRLFCKQAMGASPCQQCDACHKIKVGTHPDIKHVSPPDGKQTIVVDQIRELIEYVSLTPHSAPKKVVVIEHADLLNVNAANSLLKTLEEPPDSSMLILVTHHPERLLPTIRSRCQQMPFSIPENSLATTWLTDQLQTSNDIQALLALSGGAPLKAIYFSENDVLEKRNQLFSQFEQMTLSKGNSTSPIEIAKKWFKNDTDFVVNCLQSWVVDIIRLKASTETANLSNTDLHSVLSSIATKVNLKLILNYYQKLLEANSLKKSNINAQMILENLLIDWKQISHSHLSGSYHE